MKKAIAFDLGTKTGAAWLDEDGFSFQTIDLAKKEKKVPRQQKFFRFAGATQYLIGAIQPEFVVYERPFSRGIDATRHGWGFAGVLELVCWNYEVPCVDQVPSAIKKWATGSGKASKDDMIEEAKRRLGTDKPMTEHEADAMLLLMYALEKME